MESEILQGYWGAIFHSTKCMKLNYSCTQEQAQGQSGETVQVIPPFSLCVNTLPLLVRTIRRAGVRAGKSGNLTLYW